MSRPPVKQYYISPYGQTTFVVRLNHYGSQLTYFLDLFAVAQEDFAGLTPQDVQVVHYGGLRIKGYFGLEFQSEQAPPSEYEQVAQLELTR